ncbi:MULTISPECIES: hypothetical protein [unclassified Streptomyces]|uniref:hypothetical protein n=1 Tax=unclassified Streptomyces TaxID=2593676 RepID=UPI002473FCDC|nr:MULTISPECIES: hypothetical protein [unclassified Streptomyces]MDH6449012.1 hypothetical protein [Streptomyces sp. SAI-119]MDH6500409.1 hypothetical protein [Streptomyces sp. SAI-149]
MRVAPLTGLAAVVFTVVGFLLFGDTPAYDAPGRQVRFYYADHQGQLGVSLYFLVVAAVLFVFFAAYLARLVRDVPPGDGWLHRVVFAGGVLVAVGFLIGATLTLALLDLADESSATPQALQALNAVNEDFFIPFVGGMGLMLLATGLATARASASPLPRWLSWAAVVLGVLVFVPWVGFFAFMAAGIWVIIVSVLLARRPAPASSPEGGLSAGPASPPGPGPAERN